MFAFVFASVCSHLCLWASLSSSLCRSDLYPTLGVGSGGILQSQMRLELWGRDWAPPVPETEVGELEGGHCSFTEHWKPLSDQPPARAQLAQDPGRGLITSPSLLRCKEHLTSPSLSLLGFLWLEQAPAGATVPPRSRRVCPKVRCTTLSWNPCKVERRIWVSASSALPASFLAFRMSLQSHLSHSFHVRGYQWLPSPHWTTVAFKPMESG